MTPVALSGAPTASAPTIAVVRPAVFAPLTRALDDVVAQDSTLLTARALLLAPLQLLQALAVEAVPALGDDVIAAERLRLLISLADVPADPASTITGLLSSSDGTPTSALCSPALLDLGALTILGLAAGRVGANLGLAEPLINNVLGLALAAGPAESLTRALASGMSTAQLAAVLRGLTAHSTNRVLSSTLAAFLADPCERARWECLNHVFKQIRGDALGMPWDGAGTGSLISVEPVDACGGEIITLQLDVSAPPRPGALDAAHFLPLLEKGEASVVFASPGRHAIARQPGTVDTETGVVQVRAPARAHTGWIGFTDPDSLVLTNDARLALRATWEERNSSRCLSASPVPVDAIPLLNDPPTPPRTPETRFDGGIPVIVEAKLDPAVVDIGGKLQLSWRVEGAATVTINPEPGPVEQVGRIEFNATAEHAQLERIVSATSRCAQSARKRVHSRVRAKLGELKLEQDGRTSPLVQGEALQVRATLTPSDARGTAVLEVGQLIREAKPAKGEVIVTIPEQHVTAGLTGTLRLRATDGTFDDEKPFGPLDFATQQERRVVLLRPGIIGRSLRRVGAFEARNALETARRQLGITLETVEPAWVDDADVTSTAIPDGEDVPATLAILERLNVLAARNPGFEDSLWVALVPQPVRAQGFHSIVPAEGARAVAVATPDQLPALLAETLPAPAPRTERLRVIGTIDPDLTVRLESLRLEERCAGPGSVFSTGVSALGFARGVLRFVRPLTVLTEARPARIVALLPITLDVDSLVIARPDGNGVNTTVALRRVQRVSGTPDLSKVELADATLTWQYVHSQSARSIFAIEVGSQGVWTPVALADACADTIDVPVDRLARAAHADRVRIVASDGWNTAVGAARSARLPPLPLFRALARYAGDRVFWADLDFDGGEFAPTSIRWAFGNDEKTGPLLTLPRGFTGTVTLTAQSPEGEVSDTRTIDEKGLVDDRTLRWPLEGVR